MHLLTIAQTLADAGLGTRGTDLFIYEMPADCKKGILIRPPLSGINIDYELPGYFKNRLQVIVRDPVTSSGKQTADAVMSALTIGQSDLTGEEGTMSFKHMRPAQQPTRYPRSDGNGLEWSINFDCCYTLG